jgi:hypothetical protein
MGQRMSPQKMLCFKQGDQGCQSVFRSKVLFSRCVLLKPLPPILLPLTAPSRKPTAQGDFLQEAEKDGEPDHLKPPIVKLGSQGMDRATVRAPIPPQTKGLSEPIKIPLHITMAPQSWASAPRTPRRTGPWILLSHLLQELDIEIAVQYQVRSLWGITEDTTPGAEYTLSYPFSFPSTHSEKKNVLYNKR